MGESILLHG